MARGPFPLGWYSLLFTAVACYGLYSTYLDWQFFQITDPLLVRNPSDIATLKPNRLAEIHLPLDNDEATQVTFRSGAQFLVAPFEGTNRRLVFAAKEPIDIEKLVPPLRGRTSFKTIGGKWEVGDSNELKLDEVFDGSIPEEVIVIRTGGKESVGAWGWTLCGLFVLYLGWVLFQLVAWLGFGAAQPPGDSPPQSVGPPADPV